MVEDVASSTRGNLDAVGRKELPLDAKYISPTNRHPLLFLFTLLEPAHNSKECCVTTVLPTMV